MFFNNVINSLMLILLMVGVLTCLIVSFILMPFSWIGNLSDWATISVMEMGDELMVIGDRIIKEGE